MCRIFLLTKYQYFNAIIYFLNKHNQLSLSNLPKITITLFAVISIIGALFSRIMIVIKNLQEHILNLL